MLTTALKKLFGRTAAKPWRPSRTRPRLEALEDRIVPADAMVFKATLSNFWDVPGNWYDNTTNAVATRKPGASDDVFFGNDWANGVNGTTCIVRGNESCLTLNTGANWSGTLKINGGGVLTAGSNVSADTETFWKSGDIWNDGYFNIFGNALATKTYTLDWQKGTWTYQTTPSWGDLYIANSGALDVSDNAAAGNQYFDMCKIHIGQNMAGQDSEGTMTLSGMQGNLKIGPDTRSIEAFVKGSIDFFEGTGSSSSKGGIIGDANCKAGLAIDGALIRVDPDDSSGLPVQCQLFTTIYSGGGLSLGETGGINFTDSANNDLTMGGSVYSIETGCHLAATHDITMNSGALFVLVTTTGGDAHIDCADFVVRGGRINLGNYNSGSPLEANAGSLDCSGNVDITADLAAVRINAVLDGTADNHSNEIFATGNLTISAPPASVTLNVDTINQKPASGNTYTFFTAAAGTIDNLPGITYEGLAGPNDFTVNHPGTPPDTIYLTVK
jgi:hypothetical protein